MYDFAILINPHLMKTRIIKISLRRYYSKEPDRNAIEKCKEYLKTIFANAESITDSQSACTPQ